MSDPEVTVRLMAVRTLCDLDASIDIALPALTKALGDPDINVRFGIVVGFGRLELNSPPAISTLQSVSSNDASPKVREEANEVLALLGFQSKSSLPANSLPTSDSISPAMDSRTEVAVRVGTISVATLRQYVTAFGTVEPEPGTPTKAAATAKITSPLPGLVAEVKWAEGQRVEKGQVLFTLDSRKSDARIEQARALLEAVEKNFGDQEKISKTDSVAQLLFAQSRHERDVMPLAVGNIPAVQTGIAGINGGQAPGSKIPGRQSAVIDMHRITVPAARRVFVDDAVVQPGGAERANPGSEGERKGVERCGVGNVDVAARAVEMQGGSRIGIRNESAQDNSNDDQAQDGSLD